MKKFGLYLLLFYFGISYSQTKEVIEHEDRNRTWLIHLPENYSETNFYPLVITLHGGGGSAKQLMRNTKERFNELSNSEGFIVVYPQGIKKSWNDNPNRDINGFARKENIDDVGFLARMIKDLKSRYSINPDAIFACGISNGGLMAQTLALELPEEIKAISMVASNFGKNQIEETENPQPFAIQFIHGVDDPLFPYSEGEIGVFNKPRGKVLGIDKSIEYMIALNGNIDSPTIEPMDNNSPLDRCHSERIRYPNNNDQKLTIELIKVYNGGHTWPGSNDVRFLRRIVGKTTQDFNACEAIWSFFRQQLD